jgi:hyperosmotically inducible protein
MRKLSLASLSLAALLFAGLSFASTSPVVSDSVITTEIKANILKDKLVSSLDVSVETNNGIVTLSGQPKSSTEAERVIEIAYSTSGVKDIETSDFKIQGSDEPFKDAVITAKVKGVFAREKLFGDKQISVTGVHVETVDGVVSLSGAVKNKAQAETAEKLAKQVKGVKEVKSGLEVK